MRSSRHLDTGSSATLRTVVSETGPDGCDSLHVGEDGATAQPDRGKDDERYINVDVFEAVLSAGGGPVELLDDTIPTQ